MLEEKEGASMTQCMPDTVDHGPTSRPRMELLVVEVAWRCSRSSCVQMIGVVSSSSASLPQASFRSEVLQEACSSSGHRRGCRSREVVHVVKTIPASASSPRHLPTRAECHTLTEGSRPRRRPFASPGAEDTMKGPSTQDNRHDLQHVACVQDMPFLSQPSLSLTCGHNPPCSM